SRPGPGHGRGSIRRTGPRGRGRPGPAAIVAGSWACGSCRPGEHTGGGGRARGRASGHTSPMATASVHSQASYAQRIAFVAEMAARLHRYGTTAQRLEAAITALSQRLDLECEAWSNPTGLILSFSDPRKPLGSTDTTRVIRLPPGESDLHKLCEADRIAEAVANGHMSIAQGHTALRTLDRPPR